MPGNKGSSISLYNLISPSNFFRNAVLKLDFENQIDETFPDRVSNVVGKPCDVRDDVII